MGIKSKAPMPPKRQTIASADKRLWTLLAGNVPPLDLDGKVQPSLRAVEIAWTWGFAKGGKSGRARRFVIWIRERCLEYARVRNKGGLKIKDEGRFKSPVLAKVGAEACQILGLVESSRKVPPPRSLPEVLVNKNTPPTRNKVNRSSKESLCPPVRRPAGSRAAHFYVTRS